MPFLYVNYVKTRIYQPLRNFLKYSTAVILLLLYLANPIQKPILEGIHTFSHLFSHTDSQHDHQDKDVSDDHEAHHEEEVDNEIRHQETHHSHKLVAFVSKLLNSNSNPEAKKMSTLELDKHVAATYTGLKLPIRTPYLHTYQNITTHAIPFSKASHPPPETVFS